MYNNLKTNKIKHNFFFNLLTCHEHLLIIEILISAGSLTKYFRDSADNKCLGAP